MIANIDEKTGFPSILDTDGTVLGVPGTYELPAVLKQDGLKYLVFSDYYIPHFEAGKLYVLAEAPLPAELDRMEGRAFQFMTVFNAWMRRHEEETHHGHRCDGERANLLAFMAHRLGVNDRVWELYEEAIALYEHNHHKHGH